MNIVPVVKAVAGLASSLSSGFVVGNVIKATTPGDLKTFQKIAVNVGGAILAGAAGQLASNYVEDQIQDVVDGFRIGRKNKATSHFAEAGEHVKEAAAETAEGFKTTAAAYFDDEESKSDTAN